MMNKRNLKNYNLNLIFYKYGTMIPKVKCQSCGLQIGYVYLEYKHQAIEQKKAAMAKYNVMADNLSIASDVENEFGHILDSIGIVRECCRTNIMSSMQKSDYVA